MTPKAKLALGAGAGVLTTLVTDAALQYFTDPVAADGTENWYNKYSALLGGGASLITSAVLWKVVGTEEALVCAIAGIGSALVIPAREMILEAKATSNSTGAGTKALPAGNAANPKAIAAGIRSTLSQMGVQGVRVAA